MRTTFFLAAFLCMSFIGAKAFEYPSGPLIAGKAPSFRAVSSMGMINFPDDYFGKWKILFSHPGAYTPVCTSEIIALAQAQEEFDKLKTQLIVISVDGNNSNMNWLQSIEAIEDESLPKLKVHFPLVSDHEFEISRKYGLLQPGTDFIKDIRGVVFIDPDDHIRAFFHYPNEVGRSVDEILRTLTALQTADRHDVLMPSNWQSGDEVLINSPESIEEAEKMVRKSNKDLRKLTWYMWYRKL